MKLLDLAAQEGVLETHANPFAKIVLAHLMARQMRGNPADRHAWKILLVRRLYKSGLNAKDVRELFRLIDWMMELPPTLNKVFWQEVDQIEEENRMPYVLRGCDSITFRRHKSLFGGRWRGQFGIESQPLSIERVGICKGLYLGIETALTIRFGEAGLQMMPEIRSIYDENQLRGILKALETATSPEEVRRLWTTNGS